ncbi:MAG: Holliday junction resolvase RuvX, partial [Firmicutes bacterium HGW-Firmicutes-6]
LAIEIIYIDERLTSSWSEKVLIEGNVSRENRKDYIDMLAAQIILQSYMDRAVK